MHMPLCGYILSIIFTSSILGHLEIHKFTFNFMRNCQIIFHSNYII